MSEPLGFVFAFANCLLFTIYIVLGHRVARAGGTSRLDRLGAAMLIALVVATPIGAAGTLPVFGSWLLLAAAIGVGVFSSVLPYVIDQLAMSRLPRATFALMLSLLPATATVIGLVVLAQVPTLAEVVGVALVVAAVAIHREVE